MVPTRQKFFTTEQPTNTKQDNIKKFLELLLDVTAIEREVQSPIITERVSKALTHVADFELIRGNCNNDNVTTLKKDLKEINELCYTHKLPFFRTYTNLYTL